MEVDETLNCELKTNKLVPSSLEVAQKVEVARGLQLEKYKNFNIRTNSQLDGRLLQNFTSPKPGGRDLLEKLAHKNRISLRGYNRTFKVARTIADLDKKETITIHHIVEVLNYRAHYST